MKTYKQEPQNPDNWLTALYTEDETQRNFAKVVFLPIGQAWDEVTDGYYREWKEKYQPTPEPETQEPVAQPTE